MKHLTCIITVSQQRHIRKDHVYLDVRPEYRQLRRNLHIVSLPLRQFRFIQALMANHPKPMTHWDLFYHVWGQGSAGACDEDGGPLVAAQCIQQLAAKLRVKLAPLGLSIEAPRKGYGYQLLEKQDEEEARKEARNTPPANTGGGKAREPVRPVVGSPAGDTTFTSRKAG